VLEDEKRWLQEARQGDEEAFSRIVEAFQRPVFTLCYRMLGERTQAEDAAQETFLRAFLNLKRYDMERPFITWLLSIASNHCIDRLRRRRLRLVPLEEAGIEAQIADAAPGPESALAQSEQERELHQSLLRLAHKDRAAVVLHYWHGLSLAEVGETLSLTPSAVKSRLHRARRQMAEHLLSRQPELVTI
jgi:RNA polymerase sigma-70 factor (ECF subfamily)